MKKGMDSGENLFWVPTNFREKKINVTVTKIGRKWAYLSNGYKIDKNSLKSPPKDNLISPGRCFLSHQDYLDKKKIYEKFEKIKRVLQHIDKLPDDVTLENLKKVEELLQL